MAAETTDYLIVGAGVAGLALAADLQATGASVRLLDKGRGVGGRTATRRLEDGLRVDHGAQYFTARTERFQAFLDEWLQEPDSTLAVWNYGYPKWKAGQVIARESGHPRYAPVTGMSELPKRLARGLDVQTGITVTELQQEGGIWIATGSHGTEGETARFTGKFLILTLPPEQLLRIARDLLPDETRVHLEAVSYNPAWTLVLPLEQDLEADWPALEVEDHPVIGMISRDHTKRRDPNAPPVLIVHGSGPWSKAHLEDDKAKVRHALLTGLQEVVGPFTAKDDQIQVHRWRYAVPTQLFGAASWYHPHLRLAGCGDAYGGLRVEGAITSGWHLAETIQNDV